MDVYLWTDNGRTFDHLKCFLEDPEEKLGTHRKDCCQNFGFTSRNAPDGQRFDRLGQRKKLLCLFYTYILH